MYNGKIMTFDPARKTVSITGGRTVALSAKRFDRAVDLFVRMDKLDSVLNRFEIQRERGQKVSQKRFSLSAAVPASFGSMHANLSRIAPPNHVSPFIGIFDGSDLTGVDCLDIAQNMKVATATYEYERHQADDLWTDIYLLSPADYENGTAALEWLGMDALQTALYLDQNNLTWMAGLYNTYGCWSNNWEEAAPDYNVRFTPGDASSGGIGTCSTKWGTIQISYNGGLTWTDLWSGYYTECQT